MLYSVSVCSCPTHRGVTTSLNHLVCIVVGFLEDTRTIAAISIVWCHLPLFLLQ